ncbi:MAG: 3-oxoacyl-[acyl-carrier-protein] synthase III C-terminal domain-containing protein [Acidobacteriota bacterium]|nr:3-oxoacyl-[acyl-carrier-protein] synthase III C-terminal domain-containing protein [Acidobacteriota bacterium]
MPRIVSIATAVPPYRYSQTELKRHYATLHREHPETLAALSIFDHAGVEYRHLSFPVEYYLAGPSYEQRNDDFVKRALSLSEQAIGSCLRQANVAPEQVSQIISVTTTGLATPSLEAMLVELIPFSREVQRTPLFGVGCAGGAVGLARTSHLLRSSPKDFAILLSVELCAQTFIAADHSKLGVVAASLFGDGAAAALLAGDSSHLDGPLCVGAQSVLFPNTHDIMGWRFTSDGMQLVLSPRLPALVKRVMPPVIRDFLSIHHRSLTDIRFWIFHPGSRKVLDAYEESLELQPHHLYWSRHFLGEYGNLSSASVLFILHDVMRRGQPQRGDYGLVVGVGPGFSAELILLQW